MEDRIVKITVAGKVKEYEDGLNVTQLIEKVVTKLNSCISWEVEDNAFKRAA